MRSLRRGAAEVAGPRLWSLTCMSETIGPRVLGRNYDNPADRDAPVAIQREEL
jgi:hypothetical protein